MRERRAGGKREREGREGERIDRGKAEETGSGFDKLDGARWKTDWKRREAAEGRLWVARVCRGRANASCSVAASTDDE